MKESFLNDLEKIELFLTKDICKTDINPVVEKNTLLSYEKQKRIDLQKGKKNFFFFFFFLTDLFFFKFNRIG